MPGTFRVRSLAGFTRPMLIEHAGATALVLPEQDRIVSDAGDKDALVDALLSKSAIHTRPAELSDGEVDHIQFQFGARLSSVLWSLALRDEAVDSAPWHRDASAWRIAKWPRFDQWGSSPETLRLAALFTTRAATVGRGGTIAKLASAKVAAFLTACDVCGIEVFACDPAAVRQVHEPAALRGEQLSRMRSTPEIPFTPGFLQAHDFRA